MAKKMNEEQFIERKNGYIETFILSRPDDLAVKEILADKDQVKKLLEVFLSWIRDAMLVKAGVDDSRVIHLDRISDLRRFQDRYSFDELRGLNKLIINMHKLLLDNLNIKLPFLILGEQLWEK